MVLNNCWSSTIFSRQMLSGILDNLSIVQKVVLWFSEG